MYTQINIFSDKELCKISWQCSATTDTRYYSLLAVFLFLFEKKQNVKQMHLKNFLDLSESVQTINIIVDVISNIKLLKIIVLETL